MGCFYYFIGAGCIHLFYRAKAKSAVNHDPVTWIGLWPHRHASTEKGEEIAHASYITPAHIVRKAAHRFHPDYAL